jgi:NADPH:quinone reductase-like Zn-dependent oxidoreductase
MVHMEQETGPGALVAQSFWIDGPGSGTIRRGPLPPPGAADVQVRTKFSGISRGTEGLVFDGRVPESEQRRMRAPFQEGEFPFPVKYGYACVGKVEQGPAALLGRDVFCLHPHQDRFVVPADHVVPLPSVVPPGRAVLAANMETAINALWDAAPAVGDRVCVIGAGVVGALCAWLASSIAGTRVTLVDIDAGRAALAARLGVAFALPSAAPDEQDLVIHASGSARGLRQALALAGTDSVVLELSWYGNEEVALPLGEAFHARRLVLRSSQVGTLPAGKTGRWSHRRRMELALSLLADERLDALISGETEFAELPVRYAGILEPGSGALCHRVRYGSPPQGGRPCTA